MAGSIEILYGLSWWTDCWPVQRMCQVHHTLHWWCAVYLYGSNLNNQLHLR